MREHVFDPDEHGDCRWSGECPLPERSRFHISEKPQEAPQPPPARVGVVQGPSLASTSQAAALDVWPRAGSQQDRVLRALIAAGERGATDDELLRALPGFNPSSLRPRRLELIERGLVRAARDGLGRERTRATSSGRDARVYVATEAARAHRAAQHEPLTA